MRERIPQRSWRPFFPIFAVKSLWTPPQECQCIITFCTPITGTAANTALTKHNPQNTHRFFGSTGINAKKTNGSTGMQNRIKLLRAQIS